MPVSKITKFLDEHGVNYELVNHKAVYTAQEAAAESHVTGRHFAKVVMVKVDGNLALAVVPATRQVDLDKLAHSVGAKSVELATEEEFAQQFPQCETGAMPPFGNLFDMETFVSPRLAEAEEVVFNAGTHTESMRLRYADFERLVKPAVVEL